MVAGLPKWVNIHNSIGNPVELFFMEDSYESFETEHHDSGVENRYRIIVKTKILIVADMSPSVIQEWIERGVSMIFFIIWFSCLQPVLFILHVL